MIQAFVEPCREPLPIYLVTEENEDAPRALVEEPMDLIGWEGQQFSQFPHELYSTEFIQRDLLIKAWGCGQHRGRSQWGLWPRGSPRYQEKGEDKATGSLGGPGSGKKE